MDTSQTRVERPKKRQRGNRSRKHYRVRKGPRYADPVKLEFIKYQFNGKVEESVIEMVYEEYHGNEAEVIKKLHELAEGANFQNPTSTKNSKTDGITTDEQCHYSEKFVSNQQNPQHNAYSWLPLVHKTNPLLSEQSASHSNSQLLNLHPKLSSLEKTQMVTKFKSVFPSLDPGIIAFILEENDYSETAALNQFTQLTGEFHNSIWDLNQNVHTNSNHNNSKISNGIFTVDDSEDRDEIQEAKDSQMVSQNYAFVNQTPAETLRPDAQTQSSTHRNDEKIADISTPSDDNHTRTNSNVTSPSLPSVPPSEPSVTDTSESSSSYSTQSQQTSQQMLDFLNCMFPEYDVLFLKSCLEESHNNLEAAIELILPILYDDTLNKSLSEENERNDDELNSDKKDDAEQNEIMSDVSIVDGTAPSVQNSMENEKLSDEEKKLRSLRDFFPSHDSNLLSCILKESKFDLQTAVERILQLKQSQTINRNNVLSTRETESHPLNSLPSVRQLQTPLTLADKIKLQQIQEKFRDADAEILESVFRQHNCLLEPTLHTLETIYGLKINESSQPNVNTRRSHTTIQPKKETVAQKKPHENRTTSHQNISVSLVANVGEKPSKVTQSDVLASLQHAHQMINRRNECYRLAARAYIFGNGAQAAAYKKSAQEYDEKVKSALQQASRYIYLKNQMEPSTNAVRSVDFHGLREKEALIILENLLHLYRQASDTTQYLRVITGVGKHSPGGIPVLKPAVIEYLLKNNLEFHIESGGGAILIHVKS